MKTCKKCEEVKPLSDLYRAPGGRDGHRGECKVCTRAYQAKYRAENAEANRERARQWSLANPERVAARAVAYRALGKKRLSSRKSYLKRTYGMTLEDYDEMLQQQSGVCAICRRPPKQDESFHVDHDHETGEIRGLLCFPCNNFLGDIEDDVDRLQRAAEYLDPPVLDPEIEAAIRERLAGLKAVAGAGGE